MEVVTALLLAVLEVVPPVILTKQFGLPPVATSLLFGVTSLTLAAELGFLAGFGGLAWFWPVFSSFFIVFQGVWRRFELFLDLKWAQSAATPMLFGPLRCLRMVIGLFALTGASIGAKMSKRGLMPGHPRDKHFEPFSSHG